MKNNVLLKQPLLHVNKRSVYSQLLYSSIVVAKAIENLPRDFLYGDLRTVKYDYIKLNLAEVAFNVTNLHIDDQKLYGDVELLNTPMGLVLQGMPPDQLRFSVTSIVSLGENKYVNDMQIIKATAFNNMIEHGILNDPYVLEPHIPLDLR